MKINFILMMAICLCAIKPIHAQTINWANLKDDDRHLASASVGLEHGVVYGLSYAHHLKSKIPLMLNIESSIPSGKKFFDDFKIKLGIQAQWFEYRNIRFSTKINGVLRRRHETTTVTLFNLGSDVTAVLGYYKPKFFVAVESGFDNAIVTHFKHSQAYRDNFPSVADGWYKPGTGGNFYYGFQTGFSFKKNELYLRLGKTMQQDFKTKPQVPIYGQLGYILKR